MDDELLGLITCFYKENILYKTKQDDKFGRHSMKKWFSQH